MKPKKEDLRIRKTRKALYSALFSLLERQSFAKITVHAICTESLVSKTAFYSHFKDKFDLLGQWLAEQRKYLLPIFSAGKPAEKLLYDYFCKHSTVIENLFEDADHEQQDLIYQALSPNTGYPVANCRAALAEFVAGGLFRVIFCQIGRYNKEDEVKANIQYVHRIILAMLDWDSNLSRQESKEMLKQ
jgi:AcrR family transcriptional regulator